MGRGGGGGDDAEEGPGGARGCCGSWEQQDELSRAEEELSRAGGRRRLELGGAQRDSASDLKAGRWEGHCIVHGERVALAMELRFARSDEGTAVEGEGVTWAAATT